MLPGDVLVTVNDQLPTDPSKMGIWMKSFPRPFTLQFVRVTHTLDGLICACILPAPQYGNFDIILDHWEVEVGVRWGEVGWCVVGVGWELVWLVGVGVVGVV